MSCRQLEQDGFQWLAIGEDHLLQVARLPAGVAHAPTRPQASQARPLPFAGGVLLTTPQPQGWLRA